MVSQLLLAATSLALLVALWLLRSADKTRRPPPPGPPSLPVIGALPWILGRRQPVWDTINEFAIRYGPVFHVQLGLTKAVFLTTDDVVNEFLSAYTPVTAGERMDEVVCKLANLDQCYSTCLPATDPFVSNLRSLTAKVTKSSDAVSRAVTAALHSLSGVEALDSWDLGGRFAYPLAADLGYGLRKTPEELAAFPLPGALGRFGGEVFSHVTFASKARLLSFPIWCLLHPWATLKLGAQCKRLWSDLEDWWAWMAQRLEREVVEGKQNVYSLLACDRPQQAVIMSTTFFMASGMSLDIALRALFGCIAYHSEVQAELVQQLVGWQLGDSSPPLALSTVIETIRLFPERPISHPFILGQDIMLRGYEIEKGTKLFVLNCKANTSRHGVWDPVGALKEGQGENTRPRWTFGFGRRRCPAMHFAVPATATYLCAVLSRYQIDFADEIDRSKVTLNEALNLSYDGSFQMAWPPPLRLTPRKGHDA